MKLLTLLATSAVVAVMAAPMAANAGSSTRIISATTPTTIKEEVKITQIDIPGANKVYFTDFDANKDGILSMSEVGDRLFKSFDRDGNGTLDSREWEMKSVITVVPVSKQTLTTVDMNSEGQNETASYYAEEQFMQQTGLSRFDGDSNGLSAREFIGKSFKEADLSAAGGSYSANSNGYVNKKEFQSAYRKIYEHKHDNPDIYNK